MSKDLSTLKTLVWVLFTIDDEVSKKTSLISKDMSIYSTHKRFLSSMSMLCRTKLEQWVKGFLHLLHW